MTPVSVVVDTPVWSYALRRSPEQLSAAEAAVVTELRELIRRERAVLAGPVRQEVLSGIPHSDQFESLRRILAEFSDLAIETGDYEQAARFFNICRTRGIAATQNDMLISALAVRHDFPIFTTDRDFAQYAKHLPVRLHKSR